MRRILFMAILMAAAALLSGLPASAQITTSRVDGVVTDASGGVVPGATVTLINNGTELAAEKLTNDNGLYVFPQVGAGNYRITVEMTGFKVAMVDGIIVGVNVPRTVNIQLEVGDVSQSIEVTADLAGSLINTVNAELNTVVDRKQIESLPLIGRNPTDFALMQAGVTGRGNARTASVNGARGTYSNLTLDGINNQDNFIREDGFFGVIPVKESFIEEFNLTTANSDVDAGVGSSQTKMVTRSGSNEFRGEAFYYHQNSALNANEFFNNSSGVPKPQSKDHQYGFNIGGPIIKNKLFFFVNWEEQRSPGNVSVIRTVLTDQAKNGAFTYLRQDNGESETVNLFDISGASADSAMTQLLSLAPAPFDFSTGDGTNTGGYRFNSPANSTSKWLSFRVDYNAATNHTISAILHQFRYKLPNDPYNDLDSVFPGLPGGGQKSSRYLGSISLNSVLRPTITNELRFGTQYAPVEFFTDETFASGYRLDIPLVDNPVQTFLPQGRNAPVYDLMDNLNWVRGNHTFKLGGGYRWTRVDLYNDAGIIPEYTLAFGVGNQDPLDPSLFPGGISGGALVRASDQLSLLGGYVDEAAQSFNVKDRTSGFVDGQTESRIFSQPFFSLYAGDTWRMKPNLTVNIGLRWEYHGRPNETRGLALLPLNGSADVLNPNAIFNFAGSGTGRDFYHRDMNNFAPSVGLAWRPFDQRTTVIRAGYSISYVNDNNFTSARNAVSGNDGLTQNVVLTGLSGTVSSGGITPVPEPEFMVPRTLRDNIDLDPTAGVFAIKNSLRTPYIQQWNLSIQHEIFRDTALEVRYVGNRGVKLVRAIDRNQLMLNADIIDDFSRARSNLLANGDPYVGEELTVIPNLGLAGGLYYVPDLLLTNEIGDYIGGFLAPNRSFFFAGEGGEWYGSTVPISYFYQNTNAFFGDELGNFSWSTYHALQMELRRRFSSGLAFQVNYTFGKALTNFGGSQTNFNAFMDNAQTGLEKMRPDFDITHTFNANFVYDMPFGSSRRFNIENKVLDAIVGGWNLSGILRLRSGEVINIVSQRATINRFGRSGKNTVDLSGLTVQQLQDKTGVYHSEGRVYMFDPSLIAADGTASETYFSNPDLAQAGTLALSPISGPWYFTTNLALSKRFGLPIREGSALVVTASFDNVFNRTNFNVTASPGALDPVISVYNAQNINSTSFGLFNDTFAPREAQVGVKIIF
jgi:hypothetical protein